MNFAPPASTQQLEPPRTPVPELVEALKGVSALHGLSDTDLEWLAANATELFVEAGTVIFHEGDPATTMTILLRGEVHVRRERGAPAALFIGRSGQITGLLPYSRMKSFGGQGYAATDVWALQYHRDLFPALLAAVPPMTHICVSVLLDRVREITRLEQQAEKLNALGKLAGNLAHELNNPASAAQRSASGLLSELRVYGHQKFRLGSLCLKDDVLKKVQSWQAAVREDAQKAEPDTARQAEREDALLRWMKAHEVEGEWQIAPELAEMGVTTAQLDALAVILQGPPLEVVLTQFASSVRTERMAEAMLDSTGRIFDLIRAIKDYSFMDQAPIQEIDIPQSLENTLAMLQSRLGQVTIERRFAPNLPFISAYGSELNQVWMALLENALDAIRDHGTIILSVQVSGDLMMIEIWDDGPGIPDDIQARIFEPFFTTKPQGTALGLGLDVVQRVVRRHRGFVHVESRPGSTCFQIRLPLQQLLAY
ncbi:sensor histidine kinase [Paracidobacterium acidisoli]|uniref:histidine kinase n=1 Tax=Paracidobacterium acidisoli TaxID=2303751 RepID=A0A372ITC9_9BACT|nr:ATP-binding protein [Paracidobacterium acidisoli]MBT9329620.1 cyclic nucleotide-binding domain-containing protein [Paracidobacterium acidisoli]